MKRGVQILRAIVCCAALAGLVWFLIPVKWSITNIGNASGFIVCLVLLLCAVFFKKILAACKRIKTVRRCAVIFAVLLGTWIVWSAAMTACMVFTVTKGAPPEDATAIVLGSMVNGNIPSADLSARIDTAARYLKAHPQVKCIASGGKNGGETVTEASVIKRCLVTDGLSPSRILTEDTSRNTRENFINSLQVIKSHGLSCTLAVITDEYHEFRACFTARSLGAEPYAVPARTPWYIFSACWSREIFALVKYLLIP